MFVWLAMTVVMVGWDYQRGTEPPAVIAISLREWQRIRNQIDAAMILRGLLLFMRWLLRGIS
jgi:hypothetical protein